MASQQTTSELLAELRRVLTNLEAQDVGEAIVELTAVVRFRFIQFID